MIYVFNHIFLDGVEAFARCDGSMGRASERR